MPIDCSDPSTLAEAAKCFCFSQREVDAVEIYLLNVISGLNLTPNQLAEAAKCFCGFDKKTAQAAKLYLLCAAASAVGA